MRLQSVPASVERVYQLDIFNRGSLFITNITDHASGKYSWKSFPVQRNSLATDSTPAGGERKAKAKNNSPDPQEPIYNLLIAAKGRRPRPRQDLLGNDTAIISI